MARWAPDARERLRTAALELFAERGFEATTVPDIVERAGLTRRTFFRHFSDKREVFFGDDEIPALAAGAVAAAPADATPFAIAWAGFHALAAERFEPRRAQMQAARRLIESEPALRERDLQKQADLRDALRDGYLVRGVDAFTARVTAGVAVELLQIALERWLADETGTPLAQHLAAVRAGMSDALAHA
ncbi:TetR family transcriptional regulator [Microbacterium enclense]|uniref:TetR family transcriptional regulator n=1 Tax=Microbacterium enclense TaxID=993073 RepID=UPI0021A7DCC9|nr:TetR family transcriptional regulator [Microbacterium enclense]MCT2086968.1 TetR family transcriptional regulator [Microbacterium enclense]